MKPFDLEKALAGEPVVTKEGKKVMQLHYFPNIKSNFKVMVQLENAFGVDTFTIHGKYSDGESQLDLMMAEPEIWVNVYYNEKTGVYGSSIGTTYPSEEMAKAGISNLEEGNYQTTIKINP